MGSVYLSMINHMANFHNFFTYYFKCTLNKSGFQTEVFSIADILYWVYMKANMKQKEKIKLQCFPITKTYFNKKQKWSYRSVRTAIKFRKTICKIYKIIWYGFVEKRSTLTKPPTKTTQESGRNQALKILIYTTYSSYSLCR